MEIVRVMGQFTIIQKTKAKNTKLDLTKKALQVILQHYCSYQKYTENFCTQQDQHTYLVYEFLK
jgi:hypothetical protein